LDGIRECVAQGVEFRGRHNLALCRAIHSNRPKALKLLLELGADPNSGTVVQDVCTAATVWPSLRFPMLSLLVVKGKLDVPANSDLVLRTAIRANRTDVVEGLLQHGAVSSPQLVREAILADCEHALVRALIRATPEYQ